MNIRSRAHTSSTKPYQKVIYHPFINKSTTLFLYYALISLMVAAKSTMPLVAKHTLYTLFIFSQAENLVCRQMPTATQQL